MRPQRVARVGADGIRDRLPHRRRLAQPARAQLEADERGERRLGRAAGRAATAHRLGDRVALGQPRGRRGGDDVDPALDEREHGLEPGERGQLRLGLRRDQRAVDDGLAQLLGVGRVEALGELLEPVGVDADAPANSVIDDDEVQPQPPRVPEQPRVGELAHREVDLHLVDGDVEALAERGDVLRQERRLLLVEQRDADVAARDDLGGELADDLAELHGEQGAADAAHQRPGVGEHAAHLLGRLLARARR